MAKGRVAVARMRTPNGYELTRLTAVDLAARALAGDVRPGYQTPARAYGADYVLGFPGRQPGRRRLDCGSGEASVIGDL